MKDLVWVTSSASSPAGHCVQVARLRDGRRLVRNSRLPDGTLLVFTEQEWVAFVEGVRGGEFD